MITLMPELAIVPPACKPLESRLFKRLPVNRALFQLNANDSQFNMKVAEKLLTISTENFTRKWNFDPIKMKPIFGQFMWTPVDKEDSVIENQEDPPEISSITEPLNPTVLTCPTISKADCRCKENAAASSNSTSENSPSISNKFQPSSLNLQKETVQDKLTFPKARQTKITEYGRQRKRLLSSSSCKAEADLVDSSPNKRRLIDTEQK